MPWNPLKHKAVRNGIGSFATVPQICADWSLDAPYSLATEAGEALFQEVAREIGCELGYSDEQIEAIAKKVAGRIGDGLFTERSVRLALRRAFNA